MTHSDRQPRTVPTAKVREWLVWFGERATQDPKNTENRKLSNRLIFASVPALPVPPSSREERPPQRTRKPFPGLIGRGARLPSLHAPASEPKRSTACLRGSLR